jgi:alpha-galactosidase
LGLEAIRRGAGEATFLLGCGCPFGPAIGIVDAMRIGPDTAPSWNPYFHWLGWARPLIKSNPSVPALRNALRHTLNLSSLQRKWWWNDPDCLLVRDADSQLSEAEVHSAVTLTGLSGGMLVSSDDLHLVSPERQRWISLLVPNLGLQGVPLGKLEREMPALYHVKVEHNGRVWQLVGLFNWDDRPADLHLRFSDLGYPVGARLQVFDFWNRRYLWVHKSGLAFEAVPAHGCKLLRLCEADATPQLVGDTLHISMGAELSPLRIAEDRLEIRLMNMGRRVEGELWVKLDKEVKGALCNGQPMKIKAIEESIYRVEITLGEK